MGATGQGGSLARDCYHDVRFFTGKLRFARATQKRMGYIVAGINKNVGSSPVSGLSRHLLFILVGWASIYKSTSRSPQLM